MKEAAGSQLPSFTKTEELKVKGSLDFIISVHKTSYLATARDPPADITPLSLDKDRNINQLFDWQMRRTSAAYQRLGINAKSVRASLNYLNDRLEGKIPIYLMRNVFKPVRSGFGVSLNQFDNDQKWHSR